MDQTAEERALNGSEGEARASRLRAECTDMDDRTKKLVEELHANIQKAKDILKPPPEKTTDRPDPKTDPPSVANAWLRKELEANEAMMLEGLEASRAGLQKVKEIFEATCTGYPEVIKAVLYGVSGCKEAEVAHEELTVKTNKIICGWHEQLAVVEALGKAVEDTRAGHSRAKPT